MVDSKALMNKLEEFRNRLEINLDDSTETPDLENLSNGDSSIWVIDRILERAFNPTIFQLNESQNYEPTGLVVVYEEISNERFFEALDIYRSNTENYDNVGFVEYLKEEKDMDAELVNPTEVNF